MTVLGRKAAAVSLLVGLTSVPAYGAPTALREMWFGSVTAGGDHVRQDIAGAKRVEATDRFADGLSRLHNSWTLEPEVPAYVAHYGHVVLGSALYRVFYRTPESDLTCSEYVGEPLVLGAGSPP